jgi:hypothetical protein
MVALKIRKYFARLMAQMLSPLDYFRRSSSTASPATCQRGVPRY